MRGLTSILDAFGYVRSALVALVLIFTAAPLYLPWVVEDWLRYQLECLRVEHAQLDASDGSFERAFENYMRTLERSKARSCLLSKAIAFHVIVLPDDVIRHLLYGVWTYYVRLCYLHYDTTSVESMGCLAEFARKTYGAIWCHKIRRKELKCSQDKEWNEWK